MPLFRCEIDGKSAGNFKVLLTLADGSTLSPGLFLVGPHNNYYRDNGDLLEPAPTVGPGSTWEGELCWHELEWLGLEPGVVYHPDLRWMVEPLS